MKKLLPLLGLFLLVGFTLTLKAETVTGNTSPKNVYVIPIQNEIEDALTFLIRRGVKEAIKNKADILIIHMDTPGGKVSSTLDILKILEKFPHQDQTYTFIDPWAVSAGALISAGTRHIYMSPSAIIGAAAPVMSSATGGTQELPSTMEEKMNSALRAQIRAFAERNGHRPDVFNAMVDKDQGLTINGSEVVPKGKIVTLTATEAIKEFGGKTLLSAGTFENLDVFIRHIAGPDALITRIKPTGFERVGRFIVMLSPLLLGGALLCGYIEFKTPGFGFFGTLAALLALIFFFGHYIAGLSGYEYALSFLLGLTLILAELFFLPGTLVLGLSGLFLVALSVLKAMVDHYPSDPFLPSAAQLQEPLTTMGLSLVLSLIGFLILLRLLPKTSLYGKMILATLNEPATTITEESALTLSSGSEGVSLTPLRPSGTADFGQGPVDVVTEGIFIESGTRIRVITRQGMKTLVEPL
jgi:membrane-bound serine protease (ClpP class)